MRVALALLLALFLAGCETPGREYVKVPKLPVWTGNSVIYEQADVKAYVFEHARVFPLLSDSQYVGLSDDWLDRFLEWTWHFSHATGIAYTKESFDCDKFSKAASLAAEIAAGRAGIEAQPLIARIDVVQNKSFGGVDATGKGHSLNAVLTESGVWIVEPQTRRKVKLEHYPNREHIYRVRIGG